MTGYMFKKMEEEGTGFLGSIIKKQESMHNVNSQTWPQ